VLKHVNKYLFINYDFFLNSFYLGPRCSHLYSLDINKLIELKDNKKLNKKIPKQIQCSECSLVWCFRCSAPWHENLTCKQFIKGDKLLLKWINQKNEDQWNARKCPKCSSVIQRNGGCPHMTCSSCSCEFCYLCGRRYIKIPIIGQHNNKFRFVFFLNLFLLKNKLILLVC
jgi:E3 ubiquitin-protein ligase RNF217